jgi:hypothetical protein
MLKRVLHNKVTNASILLALLVSCAARAADDSARLEDYILRAKQFVREFYPSLDSHAHIEIHDVGPLHLPLPPGSPGPDIMNSFSLELAHPQNERSPLYAYFDFDWRTQEKELAILSAIGSVVAEKYDAFLERVRQHPGWSDADIATAFDEAGARFGPNRKADFLRFLPLKELRRYVGDLELVSVEFIPRDREIPDDEAKTLFWAIRARTRTPKALSPAYLLTFEPFEGGIMTINRTPPLRAKE